jgi:hypothetical protein
VKRELPTAGALVGRWVGRTIETVTGAPNRVVDVEGDHVMVATGKSPDGQHVPLADVQQALDQLVNEGEVSVHPATLGYRSTFCGAVVKTVAGVERRDGTPPLLAWRQDRSPVESLDDERSLNAWWNDDAGERYWMEITDRPDIGVDLHCPQRDATGRANAGYSTILYVREGDIVFHYDRNVRAVTAWSEAIGEPAAAPTLWASHRGATRRRLGSKLREQPGWWLDLEGPFLLDPPVTLAHLRANGGHILALLDELADDHGSIYAPFYGYGAERKLRPTQYYLNKPPAALVGLLTDQALPPRPRSQVGTRWRQPVVNDSADRRRQVEVDVETVERGLRGHVDTEITVGAALNAHGIEPLHPTRGDPNFDIAWRTPETLFVAEIKSLTDSNEERQLRLGLGQVLRYRSQLATNTGVDVQALLIPERAPTDPTWAQVCAAVDVLLIPGPDFSAHVNSFSGGADSRSPAESLIN